MPLTNQSRSGTRDAFQLVFGVWSSSGADQRRAPGIRQPPNETRQCRAMASAAAAANGNEYSMPISLTLHGPLLLFQPLNQPTERSPASRSPVLQLKLGRRRLDEGGRPREVSKFPPAAGRTLMELGGWFLVHLRSGGSEPLWQICRTPLPRIDLGGRRSDFGFRRETWKLWLILEFELK